MSLFGILSGGKEKPKTKTRVRRCTKTQNGVQCCLALGHDAYQKCLFDGGIP